MTATLTLVFKLYWKAQAPIFVSVPDNFVLTWFINCQEFIPKNCHHQLQALNCINASRKPDLFISYSFDLVWHIVVFRIWKCHGLTYRDHNFTRWFGLDCKTSFSDNLTNIFNFHL